MEFRITLQDGSRRSLDPDPGRLTIGRSRSNDVVIADGELSRHHAELSCEPGGVWMIKDCGSLNGTQLNGQRVGEATPLRPGDRITLGSTLIECGPLPARESPTTVGSRTIIGDALDSFELRSIGERDDASLAQLVFDAARALVASKSVEETLELLLDLALEGTKAERGLIAALDDSGALLNVASVPKGEAPVISRTIKERVLQRGERVILADVQKDEQLRAAQTVIGAGLSSVLCAPLGDARAPRGIFYLDSMSGLVDFEEKHLEVADVLAGIAGVTLEAEAARKAMEEKRHLEAQLAAAWEIQSGILPPEEPQTPEGLAAAGRLVPCLGVGGDLYDFFSLPDGSYGVMVADVAGKGLAAALMASSLHARWKAVQGARLPLDEWLPNLNDALAATLPGNRFVTLAFAVVDASRERLHYFSAGQESCAILGGETRWLAGTGPVLGMFEGADYGQEVHDFATGDLIALFSDGITEQKDVQGEEFGAEKVQGAISGGSSARTCLESALEALAAHTGSGERGDDTTLAVVSRVS